MPMLAAVLLVAVGSGLAVWQVAPKQQATVAAAKRQGPAADRARAPDLAVGTVSARAEGFLSWAFLDRQSGRITGSPNMTEPSDTMSMVKAWLAADYLRVSEDKGEEPSDFRLGQLSIMIRDSDNAAAIAVYDLVGGQPSILRMIQMCGLSDSSAHDNNWSMTVVSARDTVRLAACIASGRAAGARWTPWLLTEMRAVRGTGDFGVRRLLPASAAATVSIKNGWLLRDEDGQWHMACLAVTDRWAIGILLRYRGDLGFAYGTALCATVGGELLAPTTALVSPRSD
ncbi:serine hydrolase [Asanoa sp. WMMD1127]|uniref:serine hydrolase n=1 Tax=Asanoa sp. WMMD1127 TaxID=3016107 RepID=UPI002415B234|nr:serine hydrolase [Asanoa sp. WMMD1127]MDG4822518.1 serine hydrolase [Asanoa sp. WMMD1127]